MGAQAIPLLEEAHRQGRGHASLAWVTDALLTTYVGAGKSAEAFALLKNDLAADRKALPADSVLLAGALAQNGASLLRLKAWADAESVLRECLTSRQKKEPDLWITFHTKSLLGEALLGQKKYAEAEALLLAGYDGMKQRAAKILPIVRHLRLREAAERLVRLYEATAKKDEMAKWRNELPPNCYRSGVPG